MGFRGIKSRVYLQFWVLFSLSMLFIDVIIVFFLLDRAISRHSEQKQHLLASVCKRYDQWETINKSSDNLVADSIFPAGDRFLYFTATAFRSNPAFFSQSPDRLKRAVYRTFSSKKAVVQRTEKSFGILLFQHRTVILTVPVFEKGNVVGAGGVESDLTPVYADFQRIQKIACFCIFLNGILFAMFGNRQLSKIFFMPLKRLAKRAETYKDDDDIFFAVRKEDNEFSVLSMSLNNMVHRIAHDKRVLEDTIDSLKTTNLELHKAQRDVIRAEKLATVGRLTSGIAHEIGNPIGIVLGYLDLLKQSDLNESERKDFIERSEGEINRINRIIRQLLDMSRSSSGEMRAVSVHGVLTDLISVFHYQPVAAEIEFKTRLAASDDVVFSDPDQLRQVFLNILLNAIDAVNTDSDKSSRIILTSQCVPDNTGDLSGNERTRFLQINILDNGPGIESGQLEHVFDPFYTTKEPGKGTGLGLSVAFMIVQKIGGQLLVRNGNDSGAIFQVLLPLAKPDERKNEACSKEIGEW